MAFERTLVTIRERPLAELLDLALVVVRRRPVALGLAALGGILPFGALNAWIFSRAEFEEFRGLPFLLWVAEAPLATAPLTVVLGALMFGQRARPGRVAATLARGWFSLLAIHGFFRWIPVLFYFPPRLTFANEVILLEHCRFWRIFRRGADLVTARGGEFLLLAWAELAAIPLFAAVAFVASRRVGQLLFSEAMTWELPTAEECSGVRFQAAIWLGVSFFAVARFLCYIDQRIRLEGWEVELRVRDVARAMEEAGRW